MVAPPRWLVRWLRPPLPPARRWVAPDGTEIGIVLREDAAEVYHGMRVISGFSLTPRHFARLCAWGLLWWVFSLWGGIRTRLWHWALQTRLRKDRENR